MKLPRFQFRLRTLMIVVTLLAVPCWWVATQKKLVDDRQEMLTRIEKVYYGNWYIEELLPSAPSPVPALRRLLGEFGVEAIVLPIEADADLYPVIHALFPEANLQIK